MKNCLNAVGSVLHWNEESGQVWLTRVLKSFSQVAWAQSTPEGILAHTHSTALLRQLFVTDVSDDAFRSEAATRQLTDKRSCAATDKSGPLRSTPLENFH